MQSLNNPARQLPTLCHDSGQIHNDICHAHGKSKAPDEIQHQEKKIKEQVLSMTLAKNLPYVGHLCSKI